MPDKESLIWLIAMFQKGFEKQPLWFSGERDDVSWWWDTDRARHFPSEQAAKAMMCSIKGSVGKLQYLKVFPIEEAVVIET